jgi:hypothetical protein
MKAGAGDMTINQGNGHSDVQESVRGGEVTTQLSICWGRGGAMVVVVGGKGAVVMDEVLAGCGLWWDAQVRHCWGRGGRCHGRCGGRRH